MPSHIQHTSPHRLKRRLHPVLIALVALAATMATSAASPFSSNWGGASMPNGLTAAPTGAFASQWRSCSRSDREPAGTDEPNPRRVGRCVRKERSADRGPPTAGQETEQPCR